jgi:hypothetical protein
MSNKKAQSMPMNVIIVAIIVLVVLVILIAFFAGGFGSVVGKVRDLFAGTTTGQARDLTVQTCNTLCDSAKSFPVASQKSSGYCTNSFVVDHDGNADTPAQRMKCGPESASPVQTDDDLKKNIQATGDLGVSCPVSCTV